MWPLCQSITIVTWSGSRLMAFRSTKMAEKWQGLQHMFGKKPWSIYKKSWVKGQFWVQCQVRIYEGQRRELAVLCQALCSWSPVIPPFCHTIGKVESQLQMQLYSWKHVMKSWSSQGMHPTWLCSGHTSQFLFIKRPCLAQAKHCTSQ